MGVLRPAKYDSCPLVQGGGAEAQDSGMVMDVVRCRQRTGSVVKAFWRGQRGDGGLCDGARRSGGAVSTAACGCRPAGCVAASGLMFACYGMQRIVEVDGLAGIALTHSWGWRLDALLATYCLALATHWWASQMRPLGADPCDYMNDLVTVCRRGRPAPAVGPCVRAVGRHGPGPLLDVPRPGASRSHAGNQGRPPGSRSRDGATMRGSGGAVVATGFSQRLRATMQRFGWCDAALDHADGGVADPDDALLCRAV